MENTMLNKPQHTSGTTSQFKFDLLKRITNNFSEESIIGRGAYGDVYKGVMDNGQEVAVKKLKYMTQDDDSEIFFQNECSSLMRVQHPNIVRLVGYCYEIHHEYIEYEGKLVLCERSEQALCFEYLEGGSLDQYVNEKPCRLDWDTCFTIIKGVCKGLDHLHNYSIFHLDIKPANILLDTRKMPKIVDFGLSRLFSSTQTSITKTTLGTPGYTPPEYVNKNEISPKYDVFSLGVLMIHIMAGRELYYDYFGTPSKIIELVCENWKERLHETMWSRASQEVMTCIEIALTCVNSNQQERPTISKIVDDLDRIDIAKNSLRQEATNLQSREPLVYNQSTNSVSMGVHDNTTESDSTEGIDYKRAVFDEVEGNDVSMHDPMDSVHDSSNSIMRNQPSHAIGGHASRAISEPRDVTQTTEVDIDGLHWRNPYDLTLSLQALSPRPVLQLLFKEDKTASISDFQSIRDYENSTQQTLPYPPVPEVLFEEYKTARNLCFHPYLLTQQRHRITPQLVALGGKVEEGTVHDGTSTTTSNPFAPTDLLLPSTTTSHHVPSSLENLLHDQSSRPLAIPLHHLEKITDNFSDERILGQGGSGVVYKGVLRNGEMIAVKKIVSSLMPGLQKQFENEVYHLMMLKHPNIVRCVGYCYETRNQCLEYNGKLVFAEMAQRLLCLEYIPNGSLDKYIKDESCRLDWSTRYKIIEGICYGLCHLHVENGKPILHLDLKPANILLDDDIVPKITDFGLSRFLDQEKTIYTKSRDGTLGYMAPEFLHGGTITPKSDIFSLGVIIIEVVTGHRDYPDVTRTSSDGFIKLVLNKWRNVLLKSSLCESIEKDCQQIERCIQIGLICVNSDRTKRPPIAQIINMLQGLE